MLQNMNFQGKIAQVMCLFLFFTIPHDHVLIRESLSVVSNSLRPHGLYSPWNSPSQNTEVGSHSLTPGDLPNTEIEPRSPTMQANPLPAQPQGKLKNTGVGCHFLLQRNFLTQGWNPSLLSWQAGSLLLSHQGSLFGYSRCLINVWGNKVQSVCPENYSIDF